MQASHCPSYPITNYSYGYDKLRYGYRTATNLYDVSSSHSYEICSIRSTYTYVFYFYSNWIYHNVSYKLVIWLFFNRSLRSNRISRIENEAFISVKNLTHLWVYQYQSDMSSWINFFMIIKGSINSKYISSK
jgi:hypothetical protein